MADVVEVAEAHRLDSALLRHLEGHAEPDERLAPLLAALRAERTAQLVSHLTTQADLRTLAGVLDGADVPWAVVKGPAAAATFWPASDMRDYRDLDVVVHPARFGEVLGLLVDAGAEQLDLNWGLVRRQMRAELTFVLPRGTLLDLHWHPVNEAPVVVHQPQHGASTGQHQEAAAEERGGPQTVADPSRAARLGGQRPLFGGHLDADERDSLVITVGHDEHDRRAAVLDTGIGDAERDQHDRDDQWDKRQEQERLRRLPEP